MVFGQIVIGPAGSGKTTYCNGMSQFLNLIGRKTAVINLDPANDNLPYECAVNIEDLVKLEDVMSQYDLGPNGGLVYCMDYLEKNIDWLQDKLRPLINDHYLLFDFPGQVELFTLHSNAKNVILEMANKWDYRLTAVHLVDAHLCSDPGKKLTKELCEVVEDYGLVSFTTLNIQDKESVMDLLKIIDKSNGYVFRGIEGNINEFSKLAAAPTNL